MGFTTVFRSRDQHIAKDTSTGNYLIRLNIPNNSQCADIAAICMEFAPRTREGTAMKFLLLPTENAVSTWGMEGFKEYMKEKLEPDCGGLSKAVSYPMDHPFYASASIGEAALVCSTTAARFDTTLLDTLPSLYNVPPKLVDRAREMVAMAAKGEISGVPARADAELKAFAISLQNQIAPGSMRGMVN